MFRFSKITKLCGQKLRKSAIEKSLKHAILFELTGIQCYSDFSFVLINRKSYF